ncbi:hypothetical protein NA57DRAFT_45952 [Rhizodiscina lignyota]|uniref:Uncharacterized protein n=1 Tax=Rhizodiscina lignyota TaxID=1504668 RepID=A0A9P4I6F6_9PEZI|nr:hypothetical protein NA57DRAFT_45952 [Rhizodiscina lignyota]
MAESFHSPFTIATFDEFAFDPSFLASQQELRSLLFYHAQSNAPTRAASPVLEGTKSEVGLFSHNIMQDVISTPKRIEYLRKYIGIVAPWLDMFDAERTFGIQLPTLARHSPALLYAILAISARQMERISRPGSSFDSLELYQEAIRRLPPLLQARDPSVVPACVILCCLEMMSASAQDWRRHLEGCAALFEAFDINGLSGGIDQAVFWCYARMDLCGALISDGTESTLLRIENWVPPGMRDDDLRHHFHASGSSDMHANYAVYLCSRVCHLLARRTKYVELGEENGCDAHDFASTWLWLWNELQAWTADRPADMVPIHNVDSKPFPQILFGHWAAISSNQLYHTACILLLSTAPKAVELGKGNVSSELWHARRICGISWTNQHHGCLNNAIQPLWIAGQRLSHKAEHAQLVKLFRSIEAATGWGVCWRIPDLEDAWGYNLSGAT